MTMYERLCLLLARRCFDQLDGHGPPNQPWAFYEERATDLFIPTVAAFLAELSKPDAAMLAAGAVEVNRTPMEDGDEEAEAKDCFVAMLAAAGAKA